MKVPEPSSFTSTVRKLCEQIESQTSALLKRTAVSLAPSSPQAAGSARPLLERTIQELSRAVIQTLSARLPALITLEEETADRLEDLVCERDEYREKYRRVFGQYEQLQLENDKLKVEVVALSDSYEQLSISFEELKFKFHEQREQRERGESGGGEERRGREQDRLDRLNELNLLSRDSGTNSASSDRPACEAMVFERELFLQQIRASQKQIFGFRGRVEELLEERAGLQRENQELAQLLKGEKVRSDRFDREILDVLNKNQELKLELLEQREGCLRAQEEREAAEAALREERERTLAAQQEREEVGSELAESKTAVAQLRLQNSQLREGCSAGEERERELRGRAAELKRENERLRLQLEKLLSRLDEATSAHERSRQEESLRWRHEVEQLRATVAALEREGRRAAGERVQEVTRLHLSISQKLERKVQLLERGGREKKEKLAQLRFEVERLYEALQQQVEQEFRAAQRAKDLTERVALLEAQLRASEETVTRREEEKGKLEESCRTMRSELAKAGCKLKKLAEFSGRLSACVLPKLREELRSVRLLCAHFSSVVELEKEQTSLLLQRRQEHFQQLVEQSLLQRALSREQAALAHQNELLRWKENCRNYEERYDQLKTAHGLLEEKLARLEGLHAEAVRSHGEREEALQAENERRRAEQAGTARTVEKLREKCREVEQYFKLVEELSKENLALRGKLDSLSGFSFKSPEKELDSTSKRRSPPDDPLARFNKTAAHLARPQPREEISVNDLTAKAEFQKLRLEAARREYNLVNRADG